jgi:hypothetical protein
VSTKVVGRIRNKDLVRSSDPRHQRRLFLLLAVVLSFALPVLCYVWLQSRYVALRYEVQDLRVRLERVQEEKRVLSARIEALSSPTEIEKRIARWNLDLVPSRPEASRVVQPPKPSGGGGTTPEEDLKTAALFEREAVR